MSQRNFILPLALCTVDNLHHCTRQLCLPMYLLNTLRKVNSTVLLNSYWQQVLSALSPKLHVGPSGDKKDETFCFGVIKVSYSACFSSTSKMLQTPSAFLETWRDRREDCNEYQETQSWPCALGKALFHPGTQFPIFNGRHSPYRVCQSSCLLG